MVKHANFSPTPSFSSHAALCEAGHSSWFKAAWSLQLFDPLRQNSCNSLHASLACPLLPYAHTTAHSAIYLKLRVIERSNDSVISFSLFFSPSALQVGGAAGINVRSHRESWAIRNQYDPWGAPKIHTGGHAIRKGAVIYEVVLSDERNATNTSPENLLTVSILKTAQSKNIKIKICNNYDSPSSKSQSY